MPVERTAAWATLSASGEQTIHTSHGDLGAQGPAASPLGAVDLVAAAVAVELLHAFSVEAHQLSLDWSEAEVTVDVERGDRPRRITLVEYQMRVTTDDEALTEIASHRLEAHAPILATLTAVADHTGHVLRKRPDHH